MMCVSAVVCGEFATARPNSTIRRVTRAIFAKSILRRLVTHLVVVVVQSRREEHDRDPLARVVEMVAALVDVLRVRRRIPLAIDPERRAAAPRSRCRGSRRAACSDCSARRAGPTTYSSVSRVAADHVRVHLRDDRIDRHRRMLGEPARSEQSLLLADVPDEQHRAPRLHRRLLHARARSRAAPRFPSRRRPRRSRSSRPSPAGRSRCDRSARRRRRTCAAASDRCRARRQRRCIP